MEDTFIKETLTPFCKIRDAVGLVDNEKLIKAFLIEEGLKAQVRLLKPLDFGDILSRGKIISPETFVLILNTNNPIEPNTLDEVAKAFFQFHILQMYPNMKFDFFASRTDMSLLPGGACSS